MFNRVGGWGGRGGGVVCVCLWGGGSLRAGCTCMRSYWLTILLRPL